MPRPAPVTIATFPSRRNRSNKGLPLFPVVRCCDDCGLRTADGGRYRLGDDDRAAVEGAGRHLLVRLRHVLERELRTCAEMWPASPSAMTSISSVTEPQYVVDSETSYGTVKKLNG